MTPRDVAKKMLLGNIVWAILAVIGLVKSQSFFAVVPLLLSLMVTFFLMWLAKRKGSSPLERKPEE